MKPLGKFWGKYKPDFDEQQLINELSEPILFYTHNCMGPLSVSVSSESGCLAAGSSDGNVRYLDKDGFLEWTYRTDGVGYLWGVAVSADGDLIAAGTSDQKLYLLSGQGEVLWEYYIEDTAYNVSMSSNGQYIALGADNQGIHLFNDEGELLWSEQMEAVRGVSLSSDGNCLAAVQAIKGREQKISLYKKDKNGKLQNKWRHKAEDYMWGAAVSPDGSYIAAGSSDGRIYFFNRKGKLLWTYRTEGYVWGVSISSDGKLIAAGSSDGKIYLLNIRGELLWSYKTSGDVMDVSIASDGSYLAAASLDMNVYYIVLP